jgi:hypothetical protein
MAVPSTKRLAARLLWSTHRHYGLEVLAELMGVSLTGLHASIKPLVPLHNVGDIAGVQEEIHRLWVNETRAARDAARDIDWDRAYLAASLLIAERVEAFRRAHTKAEVGNVAA